MLRELMDELIADYSSDDRGIEIQARLRAATGWPPSPSATTPRASFVKSLKPALKLSLPALETLAVIAYKQPVTAPEVNEIRGVDASAFSVRCWRASSSPPPAANR